MNENIITLLKKLGQDEEAQKKLADCHDPEEAYTIAHGIQDGFTKEEFIDVMKSLNEELNRDLNERDLAQASGGKGSDVSNYVASTWGVGVTVTVVLADTTVLTSSAAAAV